MGVSRLKVMKTNERKPSPAVNGANIAKSEANGPVTSNS